jgi:hypothetical protein
MFKHHKEKNNESFPTNKATQQNKIKILYSFVGYLIFKVEMVNVLKANNFYFLIEYSRKRLGVIVEIVSLHKKEEKRITMTDFTLRTITSLIQEGIDKREAEVLPNDDKLNKEEGQIDQKDGDEADNKGDFKNDDQIASSSSPRPSHAQDLDATALNMMSSLKRTASGFTPSVKSQSAHDDLRDIAETIA